MLSQASSYPAAQCGLFAWALCWCCTLVRTASGWQPPQCSQPEKALQPLQEGVLHAMPGRCTACLMQSSQTCNLTWLQEYQHKHSICQCLWYSCESLCRRLQWYMTSTLALRWHIRWLAGEQVGASSASATLRKTSISSSSLVLCSSGSDSPVAQNVPYTASNPPSSERTEASRQMF
jgi:hypothetical protein